MTVVTICGGGHLAHALAATAGADPARTVRVLTRRPERWDRTVQAVAGDLMVIGELAMVTSDPAPAVDGADVVILAAPAFAHEPMLAAIAPWLAARTWVGAMPAAGGFQWLAETVLGENARIFGTARSPYNCRITEPGREVVVLGVVPTLPLAARPAADLAAIAGGIEDLLGIPVEPLASFLCVTLAPGTTLFHPARLHALFRDWDGRRTYPDAPLFYEDWDDQASRTYLGCDAELQVLCRALQLPSDAVPSIRRHYRADSPAALTARIRALAGLRGIAAPMVAVPGGFRPDVKSRFFTEDIPFGVATVAAIARLAGVATPTIDAILAWAADLPDGPPVAPPRTVPSSLAAVLPPASR